MAKSIVIPLSFAQIECRCKTARIVGEVCLVCGARPAATEVDPKRQFRQKIARKVIESRTVEIEHDSSSLEEISVRLGTLLNSFLGSARKVAMGDDDGDELMSSVREILRVKSCIESFTLRPSLGVSHRLLSAVANLESAVDSVLMAMCANTPIAAQQLERDMQSAIDVAAESNKDAQRLVRVWQGLSIADTPLIFWATEAFDVFVPNGALQNGYIDFDEIGSKLLNERIGDSCPRGFGIAVALTDFTARLCFDESRLWSIVRQQRDFLLSNRRLLTSLTEEAVWAKDWERHWLTLWEISERARVLYGIAKSDDNFIWTGLAIAHDLEEGPVKQLLASLQYVSGVPDGYQALQAKGVANLSVWANSRHLQASESFGPSIRNAHAHRDYEIEGDSVTLCRLRPPPGGPQTLTAEEFNDSVISIVESAMGMWVGTVIALHKIGVEVDASLVARSIPVGASASALMGLGGWRNIQVNIVGSSIVLEGDSDRDPRIIEFLSMVSFVSEDLNYLQARLQCPSGLLIIDVPLELLRAVQQASSSMMTMEFLALASKIRVNDDPFMSTEYVRKVVSVEAMTLGGLPDIAEAREGLRNLRMICRVIGDADLEAGVARIQTIRLMGQSGLQIQGMQFDSIQNWAAVQLAPEKWSRLH